MARRGPKPTPLGQKVARGLVNPTPDVLAMLHCEPGDIPVMYDYLAASAVACQVWEREIEHFVAAGARKCDSAFVNHTVSMMADYEAQTKLYQSGEEGVAPPPITASVELRVRLEGMGMTGAKSRVGNPGAAKTTARNAFASNGRSQSR